jgi:hypothetical protein
VRAREPTPTRDGRRAVRWPGRLAAGAVVTVVAGGACALATFGRVSNAATAYRYWSYYVANASGWQYSQRGPAFEHPVDGEVQGWRFAIQADAGSGLVPRQRPDFSAICGSTADPSGAVRVALVIDFGTTSDAPHGEEPPATVVTGCVTVRAGGSGLDALDAAVGTPNVRISSDGIICGIDGYPRTECATVVTAPAPTPAAPTTPSTPTAATAVTPSGARPPAAASSAQLVKTPVAPPSSSAPQAQSAGAPVSTAPAMSTGPTSAAPVSAAPLSAAAPPRARSGGVPAGAIAGGGLAAALFVGAIARLRTRRGAR